MDTAIELENSVMDGLVRFTWWLRKCNEPEAYKSELPEIFASASTLYFVIQFLKEED